ncbi:hypothetical protein MMC11_006219 [Xylographa trunciseda]|nr:hypothetical protein [Xylographa trunciseda]
MADDGFTSWPSSWNQYLYPEDIASDPGFLGSSSNLPAADESTFTEELTSPLDFLYSGNDLRGSGGDHSTSKAPDIFLPDFRYSPENLQHAADISPDLYTGDPHNVFASPLDIAQGGNDLQTLRGESSTSMAPHTAVAEMDPSLGEFKSDGNAPFAFNDGLLPETLMFPSSFLHGGNDLQTSQSGYSTSMAPLGLSPEPSLPPKNYQYYENVPLAFNDGFLPDKIVSPSSFLHSGSDLQTSRGGGSTSMAPCGMVPELSLSTEESQYDVNVPLVLNDGFPPESFTSPMDFSYSDKAPQVSKGKSSSCIPSQMLFNSLNVAPERFQHNGNILPAFDKVLGPEAFEFGAEYLQSDVSFQGFGNKNSTSVTNQQDQVPPSRTSTAPLNFSYSGSNLQTLNDEGYSSKSFYQDEISPPQAVAFQNNSLDSGNEWQTTGNIFPAPTPVQQDHLLGHALKCIFSGNDFQSLIGVVKRWPSASFLDIRPTIVNSTSMCSFAALLITVSLSNVSVITQSCPVDFHSDTFHSY